MLDPNTIIDQYYIGEPAVSYYIEDGNDKILFDTGYSDVFIKNAEKMNIDLSTINKIVISHGHNDHTGELQYYFKNYIRNVIKIGVGEDKMIEVVAGIIYREDGKFLIAQRNLQKNQGGLWEFPGGKVESGETNEEALAREIKEELAADIKVENCVGENIHHYPEKDIKLMFYKAKLLSDDVTLLEHEDYRWITKEDKDKFEFAGADVKVFEMI